MFSLQYSPISPCWPNSNDQLPRTCSSASPGRSPKRRRVEDGKTPHTYIKGMLCIFSLFLPFYSRRSTGLPCLYPQDLEPAMARAFEPFIKYITYLAKGNLDGYFNSIRPEDLVNDLEVELPSLPMLLLHDLGESKNEERIKHLFIPDTVFVLSRHFKW